MLKTVSEVTKMIERGDTCILAGDENLLQQLPAGNWIGGTIPYFMDKTGGISTREMLFVTQLPDHAQLVEVKSYSVDTIPTIASEAQENGFTFVIIPAKSEIHVRYAEDSPNYENIHLNPTLGWVSGVHLDDLSTATPKVFNGKEECGYANKAAVMHFSLPDSVTAQIGIVNSFEQGDGDTITFAQNGFTATQCHVNGKEENFAEYLKSQNINTKLPLVANYSGANVNVSIQQANTDSVDLYAPVFEQVEYRFAAPVENYIQKFTASLPPEVSSVFSCNCILNYLYSELEGKATKGMYGPVTFGEIAYQLLNQTLVYLEFTKA